jgi:DNA (cytosine-5)-methyltransferase 1
LHAILSELENHSYHADVRILYAPHYGVPQTRWRTVIIGIRSDQPIKFAFPEPLHQAPLRVNFTSHFRGRNIVAMPTQISLAQFVTVKEAIGDLPVVKNGQNGKELKSYRYAPKNDFQRIMRVSSEGVFNHEPVALSAINLKRLSFIPPGGNWTDIPRNLLPKGMQRARRSDHTKRYGRVDPDGLASTILTKCDPHWGAYFHYSQSRTFTVREAARLQTFTDTFRFTGQRVEQYEQVGNAVPPFLAAAIGRSLTYALDSTLNEVVRIANAG